MATNIMGLVDYVQNKGELGKQQGQQSRLASLASQSYSTPAGQQNALLGQMAQVSPEFAQGQQKQFQQQGDDRARKAAGAAKYVLSAVERGDPAAIQGAYRTVYPYLSELVTSGGGQAPPEQWDPVMAEGMHQILAAVEGGGSGGQGVQSTYVDDQNQRVAIMRDGSTRVLGGNDAGVTQQTITINGPDGRPAQYTFDRRTAEYIPAGASMGAPQVQPSAPQAPAPQGDHFAALTGLAGEFPGVQMTSGMRTPGRNAEVGGVPNSQHVRGTAADYAVPQQLKPAFMSRARQLGYQPIDEGDHIHLQLPRGGSAQGGTSPFVGRSPDEQAALTEAAKEQVQLGFLPQRGQIEAQNEAAKLAARQGVERIPAPAMKMIQDIEEKASTAGGIITRMAKHRKKIATGDLQFGPVSNVLAKGRNYAGQSTEQSRNFQLFMSDLEKMRNDSLRLNNGVQTEGDAQRAWNELYANLNDSEYVLAGLDRIDEINQRASQLYRRQAGELRGEYGRGENLDHIPPMSDFTGQSQGDGVDDLLGKYGIR